MTHIFYEPGSQTSCILSSLHYNEHLLTFLQAKLCDVWLYLQVTYVFNFQFSLFFSFSSDFIFSEAADIITAGSRRKIATSTLAECEFYADNGYEDILFAYPITGDKMSRWVTC